MAAAARVQPHAASRLHGICRATALNLPRHCGVPRRVAVVCVAQLTYDHPESMREPHQLPLTKCPIAGAADFRARETVLKCETYANLQPRPKLMRALLPALRRLEPYDVVVGVHLRTGMPPPRLRREGREVTVDHAPSDGPRVCHLEQIISSTSAARR